MLHSIYFSDPRSAFPGSLPTHLSGFSHPRACSVEVSLGRPETSVNPSRSTILAPDVLNAVPAHSRLQVAPSSPRSAG
jgi:hypothetical protein